MSLPKFLLRTKKSITPTRNRATGGHFITIAPAIATTETQLPVHTTAPTIGNWGNMTQLLAATANLTECWIEAIVLSQSTAAPGEVRVGVTVALGAGILVEANAEAVVGAYVNTAAAIPAMAVVPLKPPVYIAAGNRIAAAVAGVKKVDCYLIISRNK